MRLTNFLLTLHILGAIAGFGPTFAYPIIGRMASQPDAPVPWLLRLIQKVEEKVVIPTAATLQPGTGAGLIVIGGWDPFTREHRWLLSSLILYVVAFAFAVTAQRKASLRAIALADAGDYGPAFGATVKRVQGGGRFLTVLIIAIAVLMVVKPGS